MNRLKGPAVMVVLLDFLISLVEVTLGLRFILKLFGANADNSLVSWIYEISAPLLSPFRGIFPVEVFKSQYILEFSTLFAIFIYLLIRLFLEALIVKVGNTVTPRES